QNSIAPKTVIATQVVDTSAMMLEEVQQIVEGKFDGKDKNFGLDTPVVGVSDYHGLVPDDVAKQVVLWKIAIAKGAIEVPLIMDKEGGLKVDPLKLPDISILATMSATQQATASATAAK